MSKRMLALLLCVVMIVSCFAGCSAKKDDEEIDPGAYITMYLTDDIYDFDPANAYYNTDTLNVLSLMYDTLFKLDANGKVSKSLVDSYKFAVDERTGENYLEMTLNETKWSNGTRITADDVAFAWRRLLTSSNNYSAASLLYDVKNARAVKEGDVSIDNVGIEALSINRLRITFEASVDEEQFLLNLTSVATAPLLESYVAKNADWAKKPSTMVTSGPFKLGKIFYDDYNGNGKIESAIDFNAYGPNGELRNKDELLNEKKTLQDVTYFYLERNVYYYRDMERDELTDVVSSYRILVDCTKSDTDIYNDYAAGKLFYIGSIPLSLRTNEYVNANKKLSNTLSTFVLYMNQYAFVKKGNDGATYPLFADAAVRQALSKAINRDEIAKAIVYADAASGLVAPGVFNAGKIEKNSDFRTVGGSILSTSASVNQAKQDLQKAGITPEDYSFTIKVAGYDDVNVKIVKMVAQAWKALGFKVTIDAVLPIENNDYFKETESYPDDVCDDRLIEAFQNNDYEVIAMDYTAYTANADSVLMNFATAFSGMALNLETNQLNLHTTGYSSVKYNNIMEAVYYIPYYASLADLQSEYLNRAYTKKPVADTANAFATSAESAANKVLPAVRVMNNKAASFSTIPPQSKEAMTRLVKQFEEVWANTMKYDTTWDILKLAEREIARAYETAGASFAKKNELAIVIDDWMIAKNTAIAAFEAASAAATDLSKNSLDEDGSRAKAVTATITEMQAAFAALLAITETTAEYLSTAIAEAKTAANNADNTTLYDAIGKIYKEAGITPTTDSSEWAAQKATLLHMAEKQLLQDMPVIPVVFTKNATLSRDELLNVNYRFTSMYTPYYFTKVTLKAYTNYTYYDEEEEEYVSIFAEFPNIAWDKIGK